MPLHIKEDPFSCYKKVVIKGKKHIAIFLVSLSLFAYNLPQEANQSNSMVFLLQVTKLLQVPNGL